jgi:hypothetical protein
LQRNIKKYIGKKTKEYFLKKEKWTEKYLLPDKRDTPAQRSPISIENWKKKKKKKKKKVQVNKIEK